MFEILPDELPRPIPLSRELLRGDLIVGSLLVHAHDQVKENDHREKLVEERQSSTVTQSAQAE